MTDKFDKAKWKDEIIRLVSARQYVSFAEIHSAFPNSKGQSVLHIPGKPNLIVWQGACSELAEAITEMVHEGLIFMHPTDILLYLADRELLDLPVSRTFNLPADAPLSWLPVIICTFQHDAEMEMGNVKSRLTEIGDWVRGRSSHTYPSDAMHASHLARWYEKDVNFLLGQLGQLRQKLEEANGRGSEAGPGDPPRSEAEAR